MKQSCELSSWCLAVLVTAVAACSSQTQSPLTGDDDGGIDAGGDAPGDGSGPPVDAGVMPDARPPDAPPPTELAAICGAVPTTTEDWELCRVKRYCETLVHCSEKNLYTDAQECTRLINGVSGGQIAFDTFEKVRAVAAGRASVNVAAFTQCLIDFSADRCNTAATAPSCPTRYIGTVADGQGCFNDAECASPGATCVTTDCEAACCTGTCTPRAKLGEACHDFGACEPGLVCSLGSLKCVIGDAGTSCPDRLDCDQGNWCDNGICKPDLPEGAVCDSLLQCGGETSCVGTKTRGATPHCRRVTSAGDACDWFCLGNLLCDHPNVDVLGVCRPMPQINDACSALVPCVGQNLRCSPEGKCVQRTGLNLPCTDGTCLPGLFCTDQLGDSNPVCHAPFADGESGCKQDAHCQSHICTGNVMMAGDCRPAQFVCP